MRDIRLWDRQAKIVTKREMRKAEFWRAFKQVGTELIVILGCVTSLWAIIYLLLTR